MFFKTILSPGACTLEPHYNIGLGVHVMRVQCILLVNLFFIILHFFNTPQGAVSVFDVPDSFFVPRTLAWTSLFANSGRLARRSSRWAFSFVWSGAVSVTSAGWTTHFCVLTSSVMFSWIWIFFGELKVEQPLTCFVINTCQIRPAGINYIMVFYVLNTEPSGTMVESNQIRRDMKM